MMKKEVHRIRSVETLVWDLDGTLFNSGPIHDTIMESVLLMYGYAAPTQDALEQNFHGRLEDSMRGLIGGDVEDAKLQAMLADFRAIDDGYVRPKDLRRYLYPDALALARRARRAGVTRQILVTNRASGVERGDASPGAIVRNSVLGRYIGGVVCSDQVDECKPSPLALGAYQGEINPETTVVIGDQHVDVEFARRLGCRAVWVNRRNGSAYPNGMPIEQTADFIMVTSLHHVRL